MPNFDIYNAETAPAPSRDILKGVAEKAGFIPHIFGVFAASHIALHALVVVTAAFEAASFTAREREVISLTTSVMNECRYCVAGHTAFGRKAGISTSDLDALRGGDPISDPREEALHRFAHAVHAKKGDVSRQELGAFLGAGFNSEQALELLVGIAAKTMTNFASKMAETPLDDAFAAFAWSPSNSSDHQQS